MNLSFVGAGYVGLVTAVGFAVKGQSVCCIDTDENKVNLINNGIAPIYEKDLSSSMQRALSFNRLKATSSIKEGIEFADIIFIAVGTPSMDDGSADMKYVNHVLDDILTNLNKDIIIVNKSTVPVGTATAMKEKITTYLEDNHLSYKVHIISNPEFLREGQALHDFLYPDRVVLGGSDEDALSILSCLYTSFVNDKSQILVMDNTSAEMTKYAANAMLATRISFMNEISRLCDKTGANIDEIRMGIGSDKRIGPLFLKAGIGYGGSCFPKDIDALISFASSLKEDIPLIKSVKETNILQQDFFISKIVNHFGDLSILKFAIWGLAFKSGTDDVRESPAIDIIHKLYKLGVNSFSAYDQEAQKTAEQNLKNIPMSYFDTMYDVLENADALLILTDASEFLQPDFNILESKMKQKIIFDGRNIFSLTNMKGNNFIYYSVGRNTQ